MLSAAGLLSACASVPDLGARPVPRSAESLASARSFQPADPGQWPEGAWWTGYGDTQLSQLIDEGLQGSPDVIAAAARFRRAQGLAQVAGAPLLPSVTADANVGLQKQSYHLGFPAEFVPHGWQDGGRAALELSFDLDLWGRNRAALAAATSEANAAKVEMDAARLMLATAIASSYAELARLYAERDVQVSALDERLATQKLVSNRVLNGLDTRAELKQADSAVPQARADLASVDELIALSRNQLAALVGAGPDRGLTVARPTLANLQPHGLPAGVSTDLVGRRPDIIAARVRAEAAASRIKVARADFYPAINLSALTGIQVLGLENLSKRGAIIGNVGPAISLPLFRGGALSGQYRGARAAYDEAVADYDRTVVIAYREVADVIASRRALGEQLDHSRLALADAEEAYAIAKKRYEGGLSTFLDVLASEEKLLQTRRSVANFSARAFSLDVALVRALGGGFTQTTAQTPKDNHDG